MPVGIVMLPAARASSGRSVQWLRRTGRDVARHTFTCAQCRRHVDRRPWCSAGIAHGHARAVGARRHRLQSGWHTSAASIHPSLASGAESCWKRSWVYTSRPSTSTDPHRSLTGTRPRASSLSPSSRGIAAPPSASVRRTPDFVHQKVRTPYGCTGLLRQEASRLWIKIARERKRFRQKVVWQP